MGAHQVIEKLMVGREQTELILYLGEEVLEVCGNQVLRLEDPVTCLLGSLNDMPEQGEGPPRIPVGVVSDQPEDIRGPGIRNEGALGYGLQDSLDLLWHVPGEQDLTGREAGPDSLRKPEERLP